MKNNFCDKNWKHLHAQFGQIMTECDMDMTITMIIWVQRCGAIGCSKGFHAPEFVQKHLKLKHPDLVSKTHCADFGSSR
jgi:hypothetical protein